MIERQHILKVEFPCGCQPITFTVLNDYFGNPFIYKDEYLHFARRSHGSARLEFGDCIPEPTVDGKPVAFFVPCDIPGKLFIKGINCDLEKLLAIEANPDTATKNASLTLDGNLKVI